MVRAGEAAIMISFGTQRDMIRRGEAASWYCTAFVQVAFAHKTCVVRVEEIQMLPCNCLLHRLH